MSTPKKGDIATSCQHLLFGGEIHLGRAHWFRAQNLGFQAADGRKVKIEWVGVCPSCGARLDKGEDPRVLPLTTPYRLPEDIEIKPALLNGLWV